MIGELTSIFILAFFGTVTVGIIKPQIPKIESIALGYLLGLSIVTFIFFIVNTFNIPFSIGTLLIIIFPTVILAVYSKPFSNTDLNFNQIKSKWKNLKAVEKTALIATTIIWGITTVSSLYWPVRDWDSIVLYDFRAITFVDTGFMTEGINRGYFFGYPLLTSLGHTIVYVLGGSYPGIIHSTLYGSFLILTFISLRKYLARKISLILTLIIACSPSLFIHAQMTYTNLSYTVFFITGIYYILVWLKSKSSSDLLISSLLIAGSTWSRSAEPFWILPILVVLFFSFSEKKLFAIPVYLIPITFFKYFWSSFERSFQPHRKYLMESAPTYATALSKVTPELLSEVTVYYFQNVIFPNLASYILLLLCIFLLLLNKNGFPKQVFVLMFIITSSLILTYIGVLIFSINFSTWREIGGSATRMTMFVPILTMYFCGVVLSSYLRTRG